jgi:hypothetical protein
MTKKLNQQLFQKYIDILKSFLENPNMMDYQSALRCVALIGDNYDVRGLKIYFMNPTKFNRLTAKMNLETLYGYDERRIQQLELGGDVPISDFININN